MPLLSSNKTFYFSHDKIFFYFTVSTRFFPSCVLLSSFIYALTWFIMYNQYKLLLLNSTMMPLILLFLLLFLTTLLLSLMDKGNCYFQVLWQQRTSNQHLQISTQMHATPCVNNKRKYHHVNHYHHHYVLAVHLMPDVVLYTTLGKSCSLI